jgi:hypothetical protein
MNSSKIRLKREKFLLILTILAFINLIKILNYK